VHSTSYTANGRPVRDRGRLAICFVHEPDFRLLFMLLVRMSIVAEQDVLVSRKFCVPPADREAP